MQLTDIGANLAHDSFDDDRSQVLERARAVGVERLMITGSDLESSRAAIAMAHENPGHCFATAGLHPHQASAWDTTLATLMNQAGATGDIVAVGETGLDFFRDISPRDVQERVFEAQLDIARTHALPVFLHQRDAHARFLPILEDALPDLTRAVVHCFTDTAAALDAYLSLDLYIGITGWICDERRGKELYEIVDRIPDDRLMIETDSPYLMPRTIRPKPKTRRNEPANLTWVLESVASARGQSIEHVAAITHANAARFFGLEGA
ncbi:TatD family hydrolase [Salinisphaera aquimarina]|uniref:TatD family hydrolase n=1 Tax=Salinisphaera aquimarina TaxID=2094031 RepID=A0ABV7ESQ6_9GAMM